MPHPAPFDLLAGLNLEDAKELGFAYSYERLNVAVSRAKRKCVMLCYRSVLQPSMAVVATPETRAGFELVQRIAEACVDATPEANDYERWRNARDAHGNLQHCVRFRYTMATPPRVAARFSGGSTQSDDSVRMETDGDQGSQHAPFSQQESETQRSCSTGSQLEEDSDEEEAVDEDVEAMEEDGEHATASTPVAPRLPDIAPTDADWAILQHHQIDEAEAELRVPLRVVHSVPHADLPYEDWPSLCELPACIRGWGEQGIRVQPLQHPQP